MGSLINNALSKSIAEHITEQIITGVLKPGEKLVELIYAEEYGTSRAPVREAIYLLAKEGLVERYDLLEIRNMLENMAIERIKKHGIDQLLLREMKQHLSEMKKIEDIHSYTQLNHSFHTCLIKMSKSETIKNMYSQLGWPLLRIQSLSFSNGNNIEKSISEHEVIFQLLVDQNMHELTTVLHKHNLDVITSIQKMLK
jgi:DNA-binding GntR family transcriptional regulator